MSYCTIKKRKLTNSDLIFLSLATALATQSLSPATLISLFFMERGGMLIRAPVLSISCFSNELLGPMMNGWYSCSMSSRSKANLAYKYVRVDVGIST